MYLKSNNILMLCFLIINNQQIKKLIKNNKYILFLYIIIFKLYFIEIETFELKFFKLFFLIFLSNY